MKISRYSGFVLFLPLIKAKTEWGYPAIVAEVAYGQKTVFILPAMVQALRSYGGKTAGLRKISVPAQIKAYVGRMLDGAWRQQRGAAWRKDLNCRVRAWAKAYPDYWRHNRKKNPDYVARDNQRRAKALRRQRWGCSAKQEL